jgi:hypothetical protein
MLLSIEKEGSYLDLSNIELPQGVSVEEFDGEGLTLNIPSNLEGITFSADGQVFSVSIVNRAATMPINAISVGGASFEVDAFQSIDNKVLLFASSESVPSSASPVVFADANATNVEAVMTIDYGGETAIAVDGSGASPLSLAYSVPSDVRTILWDATFTYAGGIRIKATGTIRQ